MAKALIWLASGDRGKLDPGITYGLNAKKHAWLEDVQFVVFGASERLLMEDEELFTLLQDKVQPAYCRFSADQQGLTASLEARGAKVLYVGQHISDLIRQGYQVLTF